VGSSYSVRGAFRSSGGLVFSKSDLIRSRSRLDFPGWVEKVAHVYGPVRTSLGSGQTV
jgi:hypothetical protein